MVNRFNIRVYGILVHQNQILLVHEQIEDFSFTKFPGGGLELGEGIADCLIREFKEETGLDIEVGAHLYTTDFFQQSVFRETDQLISIYYRVTSKQDPGALRLDRHAVWNDNRTEYLQFFWIPQHDLTPDRVTFPIDKQVCLMLKQQG